MDTNQLKIRPITPDQDIPRLLSLYAAVEAADLLGMKLNEQALLNQLNAPNHDLLKDRWVVEAPTDPTALIGSGLVRLSPGSAHAEANIIVHPEWRNQGIGSSLISRVIERARQLGAVDLQFYADTRLPASQSFLQSHQFSSQGAYTEFRLPESAKLPPVIWPYGYTMRPYADVADISILTEVMNLAYVLLWGHHQVTEAEMTEWLPDLNPESIFLVFSEKGRVVGVSHAEVSPDRSVKNGVPTGYIDAPGLVTQHRRLDLYRAIVLTGIRWLYDQGQTLVEMESWGDKLEVLKMYRELGFKDIRQLVCYQLDLSKGAETN
jgi:mycothiol synthase